MHLLSIHCCRLFIAGCLLAVTGIIGCADRQGKHTAASTKPDITMMVQQVNMDSLNRYLDQVYGERNYYSPSAIAHTEAVKKILASHFNRLGFHTVVQTVQQGMGFMVQNIFASEPEVPDSVLLLSAHFDTVTGSPGADDNASGLAALQEAARVLSQFHFKHSIGFIAFDKEEDSMQGSQYFVLHYPSPRKLIGLVNMDMIGYIATQPYSQQIPAGFERIFPAQYDTIKSDGFKGDFVISIANQASQRLSDLFANCTRRYVPGLQAISLVVDGRGEDMPDMRRSDHAACWDHLIPALYLGDGANTRNPYYHTSGDTKEKVNKLQLLRVTQAVVALAATLAQPVDNP